MVQNKQIMKKRQILTTGIDVPLEPIEKYVLAKREFFLFVNGTFD